MKFTADIHLLKEGLGKVEKALPKSGTIPVLNGIHVICTNEEVILTSSDTDTSIQFYMPVDGEKVILESTGAVVWNRKVTDIIKKLPGDTVTLELTDSLQTIIKAGTVEFEIAGMDAEEYPKLPSIADKAPSLHIEGNLLRNMVSKTGFCASTSETRPILKAIYVEILKEGMVFTATDSHRLGRVYEKGAISVNETKYPVPAKALDTAINKIFDTSQGIEVFSEGDSQLILKSSNVVFFTRLLEGSYPDVTRLIPADYASKLVINRKELLQAIDRIAILQANTIKFEVSNEKEFARISINQKELGKAKETILYSQFEGEEVNLSFNPEYMTGALKAIDSDEVIITFNGAMRPFLVIPKQEEQSSVEELQLILPVRTY